MHAPHPPAGDTSWFTRDRFGMFIHWGLYALPARHEWVKSRERMDDAAYQRYFDHFNPDLYDPRAWAESARDAGMKYVVMTTKHHEGFCLWDSAQTDYKATNTPYGRDLLRPFVEAFREAGLRVGFYYGIVNLSAKRDGDLYSGDDDAEDLLVRYLSTQPSGGCLPHSRPEIDAHVPCGTLPLVIDADVGRNVPGSAQRQRGSAGHGPET